MGLAYPDGSPRDLDDVLALLSLCHSPAITLRGVSATFANTAMDQAFPIAQDLMRRFGPKGVPVVMGSAAPILLDASRPPSPAARAMASALASGPMTILSLGAATNIAEVLLHFPELAPRIERLVAMTGSRRTPEEEFWAGPSQQTPFTALNFDVDVDAWRVILSSEVPLTLVPFEVCHKVWFTAEHVEALASHAVQAEYDNQANKVEHAGKCGAAASYLVPHLRTWERFWVESFESPGFNPFDALASGYLLWPEQFRTETLPVAILEPGEGGNARDIPCLICSEKVPSSRQATNVHDVSPEFMDLLLQSLQ